MFHPNGHAVAAALALLLLGHKLCCSSLHKLTLALTQILL
jgi:hypothetical protein